MKVAYIPKQQYSINNIMKVVSYYLYRHTPTEEYNAVKLLYIYICKKYTFVNCNAAKVA